MNSPKREGGDIYNKIHKTTKRGREKHTPTIRVNRVAAFEQKTWSFLPAMMKRETVYITKS